jgi:hypothetical protein
VRGKATYGWFTIYGIRDSDGLKVRLGRATSIHVAHGIGMSIIRSTSMWREMEIVSQTGKVVERFDKPPIEQLRGR